jgi:signal transduction histidine kinase
VSHSRNATARHRRGARGANACSEALANIAQHAHATEASIQVTGTDTELRIEIADNDVGGTKPDAGSRLRGLSDRADTVGGHITITSPPNQGTRLTAQLPSSRPDGRVMPA